MLCEYSLNILEEVQDAAIARSKEVRDKRVDVSRKCDHPKGCPMYFSAAARNGVLLEMGIDKTSGFPCKVTGGRPNDP